MVNWKKLEILAIFTQEETLDIKNIKNMFDFPLLQKLEISICCFYKATKIP